MGVVRFEVYTVLYCSVLYCTVLWGNVFMCGSVEHNVVCYGSVGYIVLQRGTVCFSGVQCDTIIPSQCNSPLYAAVLLSQAQLGVTQVLDVVGR